MSKRQQLRQEIAALEHELRRVRDGLERNPSHALEQCAARLRDSIAVCQRDLAKIHAEDEPT